MRIRPVLIAWCLLLGATVAMAGAAWWLLDREADRVESLAAGTLANRTAAVADSIDLLMEAVRAGVADGLRSVGQADDPRRAVAELVGNNPYIVAGFFFRESDAVTLWYGERGDLPSPANVHSDRSTGAGFPWAVPAHVSEVAEAPPAAWTMTDLSAPSDAYDLEAPAEAIVLREKAPEQSLFTSVTQNVALKEQRKAVRQVNELNSISLGASQASFAESTDQSMKMEGAGFALSLQADGFVAGGLDADIAPAPPPPPPSWSREGWARSVVDNREEWIFWLEASDKSGYVGVWLDRAAILSELEKAISLSRQDGLLFGLVDPLGQTVVGGNDSTYSSSPRANYDLSLVVGSSLPSWTVQAFRATEANTFGQSFRLLGGLFIAGLSGMIFIGAAVLIWQARRDALEAERKTTFVANVSHELKTPLTSIRLFADMLCEGRVKDPDKQEAYLQTMLNETQRLTRLVNNVLDFSRLDRGQYRQKVVTVDLVKLVGELVSVNRDRIEAEGLELVYKKPDLELSVDIDPDGVEQILINLLDNAVKYAASGKQVEVELMGDAKSWSLRVCDFGPGIPRAARKRIFAAFHRLDDALTSERSGCGLGLSIAGRLAGEMGGELSVDDNVPSGCVFSLVVPLTRGE